MFKKILTLMLVLLTLTIFAAGLEREGNTLANEADGLFQEGKYSDAAAKYLKAMQTYERAQKEEEIPLKEKIDKMNKNSKAAYAKAKNWQGYASVLEMDYEKASSKKKGKIILQIGNVYKNKKYMNNPEKALAAYLKYEEKYNNTKVQDKIANIYKDKKDYRNAISWYQTSYDKKPNAKKIKNIASMYIKLSENQKAIDAYQKFLGLPNVTAKQKADTYKNMGVLYEQINNISMAVKYLEMSVNTQNNNDLQLKLLSLYFDNLKNYDKAMEKADLLIAKNASSSHAIFYKAQILHKRGDLNGAKTYFGKVANDQKYGKFAKDFIKSIDSQL